MVVIKDVSDSEEKEEDHEGGIKEGKFQLG